MRIMMKKQGTGLYGPQWTNQQSKLLASDAAPNDAFGYSVSISGDGNTAVVGANNNDVTGIAYVYVRNGTTWSEQQILAPLDATDDFGFSVAISNDGNTLVVGAYRDDEVATWAGAAYVYVRSGNLWTLQQKLTASDALPYDNFGYSVAISGDGNEIIVGARDEDTGPGNAGFAGAAGACYLFKRSFGTTWTQLQKLKASDAEAGDHFGHAVSMSIDGSTIIVGALDEDTGGDRVGAAYIFTGSFGSSTEQQKIQASDKQANDLFGSYVSISGDGNTVIVSAPYEDTSANDEGAVYFFTRSGSTWTEQQKIQSSDIEASDLFGHSVSMSVDGNTVVIGAPYEDTGGDTTGAAYIFTRSGNTWTQQQKIQSSDIQVGDWFGFSVSISGDGNTAIVGAPYEDNGASDAGAAYIFV